MIDPEVRHVTKAGTNLFRELGFSPAEARRLQVESRKQISQARLAQRRSRRNARRPSGQRINVWVHRQPQTSDDVDAP